MLTLSIYLCRTEFEFETVTDFEFEIFVNTSPDHKTIRFEHQMISSS